MYAHRNHSKIYKNKNERVASFEAVEMKCKVNNLFFHWVCNELDSFSESIAYNLKSIDFFLSIYSKEEKGKKHFF